MITKEDIVYIAGPMTGLEDFNHNAFVCAASDVWGEFGCAVHNPAKSFRSNKTLSRKTYMRHCINMIMESTAIYLLRGWEGSTGARLEKSIAEELGLKIYYQD
ncbi:MAG: DUF4406 domain-containing protein [Verrucomicrobiota bacterium]